MNTKEFIRALAEKLDISQKEAISLLEHTSAVFRESISEDKKLTLLHIGSLQMKETTSRSAYLPALNKKALVPPRRAIQFHAADTFKDKIKNKGRL